MATVFTEAPAGADKTINFDMPKEIVPYFNQYVTAVKQEGETDAHVVCRVISNVALQWKLEDYRTTLTGTQGTQMVDNIADGDTEKSDLLDFIP